MNDLQARVLALADALEADEFNWTGTTIYDLEDALATRLRALVAEEGQEHPKLSVQVQEGYAPEAEVEAREEPGLLNEVADCIDCYLCPEHFIRVHKRALVREAPHDT